MSRTKELPNGESLGIANFKTADGMQTLGTISAIGLHKHRQVTMVISDDGSIEVIHPNAVSIDWPHHEQLLDEEERRQQSDESQLDGMSEDQAILALSEAGWGDEDIMGYIDRRESRIADEAMAQAPREVPPPPSQQKQQRRRPGPPRGSAPRPDPSALAELNDG